MLNSITKLEVEQAQHLWAEALIKIGRDYKAKFDYQARAKQLLDQLYAYHMEDKVVLFKPTFAKEEPFRTTYAGALSYFIGGNAQFEEDQGFALKAWQAVKFINAGYYFHADMALVMGSYLLTPVVGESLTAEYS